MLAAALTHQGGSEQDRLFDEGWSLRSAGAASREWWRRVQSSEHHRVLGWRRQLLDGDATRGPAAGMGGHHRRQMERSHCADRNADPGTAQHPRAASALRLLFDEPRDVVQGRPVDISDRVGHPG